MVQKHQKSALFWFCMTGIETPFHKAPGALLVNSWCTPGALLVQSWCTPGAILVQSWCRSVNRKIERSNDLLWNNNQFFFCHTVFIIDQAANVQNSRVFKSNHINHIFQSISHAWLHHGSIHGSFMEQSWLIHGSFMAQFMAHLWNNLSAFMAHSNQKVFNLFWLKKLIAFVVKIRFRNFIELDHVTNKCWIMLRINWRMKLSG